MSDSDFQSRLMTGTLVDAGTVTASSEEAEAPATNVQVDIRQQDHWFTGCAAEYYDIDLGAAYPITVMTLLNHNLGPYAQVTLEAGISAGDDSLLSETFDAWEPIYGYGQNWGLNYGGYLSQVEIARRFPAGTLLLHYLAAGVTARYWRIGLSDPTNSNGFIKVGRVMLDWYRASERGVALGMKNRPVDPSPVSYAVWGTSWKDSRTKYRTAVYQYPYVPGSETWELWYEFLQTVGVGTAFVIDALYGIDNPTARAHNQLYCEIPQDGIREIVVEDQLRASIELEVRESV